MMYLDFDFTPSPKKAGEQVEGGLDAAIARATELLNKADEGQIGIYADSQGNGFAGYIIRYPGEEPYFEQPPW